MKKISFFLTFFLCQPLWAGTELHARVESTSSPYAWANIDGWVDQGSLKLHFEGPWTRGALIYNKTNSEIILVDDLNKMVLSFGSTSQATFKMVEGLAGHGLKGQLQGAVPSVRMAYHLAETNVQALFEGELKLKKRNVPMDGRNCDLYQAAPSGQKIREVWMVPLGQSGLSADDRDTLSDWLDHMVDLLGPELKQLGADPTFFLSRSASMDVPTHLALYHEGKITTRLKVMSIRPSVVPASTFIPPADYRQVGLLDLLKMN